MSDIIKEFMYKKADGSESRKKVLVLSKDSVHISGLDLNLLEAKLGSEEVEEAIKCVEDYIKNCEENNIPLYESSKVTYPNYKQSWNVAYRYYKLGGISPIKDENDENIDLGVLK